MLVNRFTLSPSVLEHLCQSAFAQTLKDGSSFEDNLAKEVNRYNVENKLSLPVSEFEVEPVDGSSNPVLYTVSCGDLEFTTRVPRKVYKENTLSPAENGSPLETNCIFYEY